MSQVTYEQEKEGFKSTLQCTKIVFYNLPAIHSTTAISYCPVVSECNTVISRKLTNTKEERGENRVTEGVMCKERRYI